MVSVALVLLPKVFEQGSRNGTQTVSKKTLYDMRGSTEQTQLSAAKHGLSLDYVGGSLDLG